MMSVADPDQILISDLFRQITDTAGFTSVGRKALKGIATQVFEVIANGQIVDIPNV